ncbi:MAG: T9SS type A sorting domain-containing protein, partial [Candidatus Lokiarchaeota archaeon]|nr:T9SS type A sorting domain-containing protein [Candidatus Lokiarchaeota archaeon]
QQDYRLISIPIQIDDGKKSAKDILFSSLEVNDYDQTIWRCADYHHYSETDSFIYLNSADFSPFEPGKAFFLLATEKFSGKYIQSKSGFTNPTNYTFKIPLQKGWNLIGNPYDFSIPIENTSINNGLPEVWEYTGQWINYATNIEPWQGYAIYVENNDTFRIKPDLRYPYFESGLAKSVNSNQFEWFIKINASCQNAQNNENIAAVAEKASRGFDNFDKPEPPPIGQYVMMTFPHPEWNKVFDYFTVDVQAPNVDGNFWDFNVYTNIKNGKVTLDFTNLDVVPQEYNIKLIANKLTRPVNLRKKNKISYVSNNEAGYEKFRLLVGSSEFVNENDNSFVPSEFCFYPNFPNPFNNSTNICFDVPEQIEGDICIFNVTGSQVKTIANNKLFEPGKIILTWDGTNDQNFTVSSGIYFCKIITRKYSNTIKMVLIR